MIAPRMSLKPETIEVVVSNLQRWSLLGDAAAQIAPSLCRTTRSQQERLVGHSVLNRHLPFCLGKMIDKNDGFAEIKFGLGRGQIVTSG